jgi:hypothetical protein
VDLILSRSESDNHGTHEQQIRDAFALVNNNSSAFRNARITDEYLAARLDELRWAASVQALRERDREEQRRMREKIREEEIAQREIERAIKEASRNEEALKKAMEKVQGQDVAFIQTKAASGQRHVTRVVPICKVDVMVRQHRAHGITQPRGKMA